MHNPRYAISFWHHRYLAEPATCDKWSDSADKSLEAYKAASDVAVTELSPTHSIPLGLGLALNFPMFHYEILNVLDRACHLVKQAFDDLPASTASLRIAPASSYSDLVTGRRAWR